MSQCDFRSPVCEGFLILIIFLSYLALSTWYPQQLLRGPGPGYLGWRAAGTRCVRPGPASWPRAERGWRPGWSWRRPGCPLRWGSPAPGSPCTGPGGRQTSPPRCSPPHSHTPPSGTRRRRKGQNHGTTTWTKAPEHKGYSATFDIYIYTNI